MRKSEKLEQVLPGMYVYADGLVSSEIIPNRQIKAVVGYVAEGKVYAVCLKETELPWSSDRLLVPETKTMISGKEATKKILETAWAQGKKAEAAQWCHDYAEDGVKPGEAFLASLYEWENLLANKDVINASLKCLGGATLFQSYWLSNEYNSHNSRRLTMIHDCYYIYGKSSCYYIYGKSYDNYVRPVISFEL